MTKVLQSSAATLVFLVALTAVYTIHVKFFHVDVVFYSALQDVAIAVIASVVVVRLAGITRSLTGFEAAQLAIIWLLVGYTLAISVPTVIDRSLSFYILEKLEQRGGGIRQDRMTDVFAKEYLVEHRLVDVRLTEQLQSGTIRIENGCVHLTDRGRYLATLSSFFRKNLLPAKRLLLGTYTDDLTEPFRKSVDIVDYKCN